jgi:hypothetical protein
MIRLATKRENKHEKRILDFVSSEYFSSLRSSSSLSSSYGKYYNAKLSSVFFSFYAFS